MKKIFAFMKTALVAAVGLSLFACSVDGSKDDVTADVASKDCGSVKLSIAIPKFMVPDTDTNARMVMPSTSVIKLSIYDSAENMDDSDHLVYSKEFSVANSGLSYEDYSIITAQVDDVPIGIYEAESMVVELFDSKENPLSRGLNDMDISVTAEFDEDAEPATFYTLPSNFEDISEEFDAKCDEDNDYQYITTDGIHDAPLMIDEDTVSNYDIYYEAYQITVPAYYGLNVSLTAKNESQKEVAVVVYDEDGVASDSDITVRTNATFNNKQFVTTDMVYSDTTYYVVLYTKGALTDISDSTTAKLTFTLTEFEDE